jgi:hypothetical protein
MGLAALRDEEAETSRKQRPSHLWEGKEQKRPPSEGIDCPHSRPCENEVDQSKSPRCKEGISDGSPGLREGSRTVEGDDVDTTHLLSNHDCERGKSSTSDAWDGKQLDKASDVVVLLDEFGLQSDLSIDVVEVPSSL